MTGTDIVELCKRHTIFEWSAQNAVDPIPVARAKGVYFWTPEGKRFIDFNSQLMCVNIGHGDERVTRAIAEQAAALPYANPFMATEARAKLGARLAELTPGDIDVFFFTNGGADANENAIKIARAFTGRHKILARYRSYHGGTAGAMALTGDPRRWSTEPGMPGVIHVLDPYHGMARGWDSAAEALATLEEIIQLEGSQTIAAFFLETVSGTNGILIPPDGYIAEHFRDRMFPGGLTYNSHTLACATALATLQVYEDDNLIANARRQGALMAKLLADLQTRHRSVGAVRSIGLFGIVELVKDQQTKEPLAPFGGTSDAMRQLGKYFREEGLYTFTRWHTFFTNPPLCITEAELREGFAIIDKCLSRLEAT